MARKKLGEPELEQIEIVIHPNVLFSVYYLGLAMQPESAVLKMGLFPIELQRQHIWHLIASVQ